MPRPSLAIIGCAAAAIAAAVALSAPAAAGVLGSGQSGGTPAVSLAITSVTPGYARPGQAVTVTGSVTNISSVPITGLSVQLSSSAAPLHSRGELQEFADGSYRPDVAVLGALTTLTRKLAPHAAARWTIRLPVARVGMTSFGVYPLAAQAQASGLATAGASSRTFLPFWPGKHALHPKRLDIAWVWPLIDQPRQSPCGGLVDDGLRSSLSATGRLARLLDAGADYTRTAHLTWAIDPALLANVRTMTARYRVGMSAACSSAASRPASRAASAWLGKLKRTTADQSVFVTPYADVDSAALIHHGLNSDLASAYRTGRAVAGSILGRSFSPSARGGGPGRMNRVAWPAGGIADYATLQSLAAQNGIATVLLDSRMMPPTGLQNFTPSAQTKTPDGVGSDLTVLLSDDTITKILGSADWASAPASASFAVRQRYLAETAMIAAEAPNTARSVVVAPPRHWDPPAGLASRLLAETVHAPWLRPASLGQLAAARHPSGQVRRAAPTKVSRHQLRRSLLDKVKRLDKRVRLLQSIREHPAARLGAAVAGAESAAWRGGGASDRPALARIRQISAYVARQEAGLSLISIGHVTMGGRHGTPQVGVINRLRYPVRVRVDVTSPPGSGMKVKRQPGVLLMQPGEQRTVKVPLAASTVGSTTITLKLVSPEGVPLPGTQVQMTVQATNYGTFALVIIAAALAVFVLTSTMRAVRRGRTAQSQQGPGGTDGADGTDEPSATSGPGGETAPPHPASPGSGQQAGVQPDPEEADTVESDGPDGGDEHEAAEDTDDYAWAPGWADRR